MKKIRYSAGMKAIAVTVQQIFSIILALSMIILMVLFQKNILDFGDLKNKSFDSTSYFAAKFRHEVREALDYVELCQKFEVDGKYDETKEVDILQYYNNQVMAGQPVGKKEGMVTPSGRKKKPYGICYSLKDLAEWSRAYTTSTYLFGAEYYMDQGLKQRQSIFKNGELVLSDEKSITNLSQMAEELQVNVIQNVEHYYGGSYSVSEHIPQETEDTAEIALEEDVAYDGYEEEENEVQSDEGNTEEAGGIDTGIGSAEELNQVVQKVVSGGLYELNGQELALLLQEMNMPNLQSTASYEFVEEEYLPTSGVSIWDNFMKGNYSAEMMVEAYDALDATVCNIGDEINRYKKGVNKYKNSDQGTNFYFWIVLGGKEETYTNIAATLDRQLAEFGKNAGRYLYYREKDIRLNTNIDDMEDFFYNTLEPKYGGEGSVMLFCVDTSFPKEDSFLEAKREFDQMHPWIYVGILGVVISIIVCMTCFIYLSMAAGRRGEDQKIYLNLFDRMPTEVLALFFAVVGICFLMMFGSVIYKFDTQNLTWLLIMSGVLVFFASAALLACYLSLVRRIRAGVLWSSSILGWAANSIGWIFAKQKPAAKMVIWFGLHLLACLIIFPMMYLYRYDSDVPAFGFTCFLLLCLVEGVMIIREGIQRTKVLDGIRKISGGDLEYKIALEELKGDNRRMADAVNAIGDGLFHAVEDSVKNEHLKADLITNVSHDIKTPLTSIINYVDLLKREDLENERARNYINILDTKSQRLKQLTEDLVEASKVSSGNIKLEMERINLVELVHQTEGEFDEKFEARGLTVISKLPRKPVVILADGRRIWRILENLYNNVAKYAMEHTRVYVDMEIIDGQVVFSIKNISENALNIQADELTERFIRGDISRSTEGSGLGLSIAKDLTELMGGAFEIYLDGDLFKVMIRFWQEPDEIPGYGLPHDQ